VSHPVAWSTPLDPRLLLWRWHWHPAISGVVLGLGAAYAVGWWRLRRERLRRGRARGLASRWRLLAYESGLLAVALALVSPLDELSGLLFAAHMVQHQLLLMVAAPLLLLGNPLPYVLWGLPRHLRRAMGQALTPAARGRRALKRLTSVPVAGVVYAVTLWSWHAPAAYEAALRSAFLHDVEHLSLFLGAVLFWWPLVNPAPRFVTPRGGLYYGVRIGYLLLATAQNTLLGAILALTERVLYPTYAAAPRLFGLSALDDQSLAGGIMWSGSHMYLIAVLALVGQAVAAESRQATSGAAPSEAPRRADG
jgi:cytochrome c oxidase assembly factor CtaG